VDNPKSRLIHILEKTTESYVKHDDAKSLRHVMRLADMALTDSEKIVAYCHDLLEDGVATREDLHEWGLTDTEFDAVLYLTRTSEESYMDYVNNIIRAARVHEPGFLALIVKQLDLFDHMNVKGISKKHEKKLERYLPAWEKIVRAAAEKDKGWD
jgi:uncharacterized protein YutE (UPF0331/DUF86 family)